MTKDEIFTLIKQAGMIPVEVRTEGDTETTMVTLFAGALAEFLIVAKELGSKAVFVEPTEFDDWLFTYNQAEEREDDEEAIDEDIDLVVVHPPLAKFKKYFGQHYTFFLAAKGGATALNFILSEEWLDEFENELDKAREKASTQLIMDNLKREKSGRN